MLTQVKAVHPTVPLTLYANGSGGLLERIKTTGVDVVGIDWTVDMADARRRLGNDVSLQGNVDPTILFASHVSMDDWTGRSIKSTRSFQTDCFTTILFTLILHLIMSSILHHIQDAIETAVRDTVAKAGNKKHILNLGHGVLVGTPEEGVAHMFELSKQIRY